MPSPPAGEPNRATGGTPVPQDPASPPASGPDRKGDAPASPRAERHLQELEAENHALRAEADRLRHLLDSVMLYAIVTLDLEGRITGWNEGAHAILGYEHGEILGRSGEVFFPAEDRAEGAFVKELCRAMDEGHAPNERWHLRRDGSRFWASGLTMAMLRDDGQPEGFVTIFRDNTTARAEEERRALVLAEMGHRMKNVLATVQAIAAQTLRHGDVPLAVRNALEERLTALAAAHDVLMHGGWEGAPLAEVARRALSPYSGSDRVETGGAPVWVTADAVEVLNLAFHELATNAAKHGALSVPDGRVEVSWSLRRSGKRKRLVEITWRERGGPPVAPPSHQGFGTRLLERGLAQKIDGTVKLFFHPEGLECHICLPVLTKDS